MDLRTLRIAALLSGSGMCALVYQTAWLRELRLIFGASTPASAAVLAIFMGGLGLGGLLLGRRAEASREPLKFYAYLEFLIAASAALTPLLLWLARAVYVGLGGTIVLGTFGGTLVRLVLSAMVLSVPTVLMGGTLPAAARAVETEADERRRNVAVLYGLNTLGAVLGASLSTFTLLEHLGNRGTLFLACVVNAAVAYLAFRWSAELPPLADSAPAPKPVAEPADPAAAERKPAPLWFVLMACALVGFAFLLMELTWYRMLGPLLGGSTFTFGLILAVALFGIGSGGVAYALWGEGQPATVRGFAWTCILEALFIAIPYGLGDRMAVFSLFLRPLTYLGFGGAIISWALVTTIVVLPAAFVSGVQFPMLIALLGRGREQVSRQVGLGYAWNTVGAIVGSLAGGFGLLPLLGAPRTWQLCAGLLLALGLLAVFLVVKARPQLELTFGEALPILFALIAISQLREPGPSSVWRHTGIGAGREDYAIGVDVLRDYLHAKQRAIKWEVEGVESSVALAADDGYAFVVNGKVDGNARGDAHTFVTGGLLGTFLHPKPQRALVIGLGTGETTGWMAAVPEITHVDSVEIEPAIHKVAEECGVANQNALVNPKVTYLIGDARELLLTTPARYDVVLSNPSNPYRAGVASLYTQQYYESAQRRMAPGGLFVQWVQAYDVDNRTMLSIYATLSSVFPAVETWMTELGDMLLVASSAPLTHDVPTLRRKLEQEPFRTGLRRVLRVTSLEGFLAHHVARSSLAAALAKSPSAEINTDNNNAVEFGFARSVGRQARERLFDLQELWQLARVRGEDRPLVSGGPFNWERFEDRRITMHALMRQPPLRQPHYSPAQLQLGAAVASHIEGNLAAAASAYIAFYQARHPARPPEVLAAQKSAAPPAPPAPPAPLPSAGVPPAAASAPAAPAASASPPAPPPSASFVEEPVELSELALFAEGLAEIGDPSTPSLIERLRADQPVEADIILARFQLQRGDRTAAIASLVAAFERYRSDPWPSRAIVKRGLQLIPGLIGGARAESMPAPGLERLHESLSLPFALSSLNEDRRLALLKLAGLGAHCAEAYAEFEPKVPWRRDFLVGRLNCYRLRSDPRRAVAEQELREEVEQSGQPLSSALVP